MSESTNHVMHIGFDLDGVLLNHEPVKLALARAAGYVLEPWQTASDAFRACIPHDDNERIRGLLYEHPDHAFRSPLMGGALALLETLRGAGIRYSLISRRHDPAMAFRVLEHAGLRPRFFDDVNTFFTPTVQGKAEFCVQLGITHYLDDEQKVLAALESVPHRYLFDPYRRALTHPWTAVHSLEEFERSVTMNP